MGDKWDFMDNGSLWDDNINDDDISEVELPGSPSREAVPKRRVIGT